MANTPESLLRRMNKTNTQSDLLEGSALSYEVALDQAYQFISDNSQESESLTSADDQRRRTAEINQLIVMYVDKNRPTVIGFINDNKMDYDALKSKLREDITMFGVITSAYRDPDVTEIRINDKDTIWVEKGGVARILVDEVTGERARFKDVTDCMKIIQKLLRHSKAKFSSEDTIANAITIEGFRVAAVHPAAVASEKGAYSSRPKSPACVIRKFSENKLTLKDLVKFNSMTSELANTFALLPKADTTMIVVGATGSGKTVLVQIILNRVPRHMRLYVVENPSELNAKLYDANGDITNDVVQFEAAAIEKDTSNYHTFLNLMIMALRMSPHYFCFGEIRSDPEFNYALVAANTGHKFVTTFHSPSDHGAVNRIINAVIGVNPGLPLPVVTEIVCSNIDFVISQQKLWDGSRKVLRLSQIDGVEYVHGICKAKIIPIFEFRPDEKKPGDTKIHGAHYQVGEFSERMINILKMSAITAEEYQLITKPLERDENGNMIPRLGHYDVSMLLPDEDDV